MLQTTAKCSLEQGIRSKSVYRIETIKKEENHTTAALQQLLSWENRYGGDMSRTYQKLEPLVPGCLRSN